MLRFLLFLFLPLCVYSVSLEDRLSNIYKEYQAGENAVNVGERKQAFNRVLKELMELESYFKPEFGNGKIYFDLGNTNFQLGGYPMAVYFYYKALKLDPKNSKILENLNLALHKLNLKPIKSEESYLNLNLPLTQQLQLFFSTTLIAFFLGMAAMWSSKSVYKNLAIISIFISCCLLGNLLYQKYFTPIEGVIVHSSTLFRDAGTQFAKVSGKPVLAGTKVEVLDYRENGYWLKITTSEGVVGYLKQDNIRLL